MDAAFEKLRNFSKVVHDCLVYDDTLGEHVSHVRDVLHCARANGITFSEKKFVFGAPEVPFCGYTVSSSGWTIDPSRTAAICEFRCLATALIYAHFLD